LVEAAVGSVALAQVAGALREARSVTAICHENPDADTPAGALAVAMMAERLGTPSEVVSVDRPGPMFDFLPGVAQMRRRPELGPDVAVVCDAATLERVGRIVEQEVAWLGGARIVNIDHHVSNTHYGALNLVDPGAAATCEVLVALVDELGLPLDPALATVLLAGIVRDSHGFSDLSTSAHTLRVAARLVDAGAPLPAIHRAILADLPYPTMALWGRMLGGLGERADGRVIYATLTLDMLRETGTQQHDADGLAEFMFKVKGADVVVLLRELEQGETRVSLRTTESVDATRVAARFGGGGHVQRAGCTVPAPLAEALPAVLAACEAALGAD